MEIGVFHLPTIGDRQQLEQGMAGSRTDLYQTMIANLAEEAHRLDEHGYYGVEAVEKVIFRARRRAPSRHSSDETG
jgi:hypothetical protein